MFTTGWYKFFENRDDAVTCFNRAFVDNPQYKPTSITGIQTGCFGSYGAAQRRDPTGEFYFSLAATTENVEHAIAYFNKHFTNIQIEIVAKTRQYSAYEPYRGFFVYTESGWNALPESDREKAQARSEFKEYNQYLFRIHFSAAYDKLPAYLLQIPLGFWVRMFTAYYGCLDNEKSPCKRNPIHAALKFSNNNPRNNAGYISDYIVSDEVFMAMDDPEKMNRYFKEPGNVQYLHPGNASQFGFGSSVKPYSVYYVIDHDGNRGQTTVNYR